MLRTNLSTRPFYNVRAVHAALGVLAVIVLIVTAYNAVRILQLTGTQQTLGAHAVEAENEAVRLRGQAVSTRAQINPKEIATVSSAAREANAIIDQRAFSWSELLVQFESTLPQDVRIMSVQPRLERDGTFVVTISVQARRVEDLDALLEALENQGSFHNVLSLQERTDDDGLLEAVVEGVYVPPDRGAAAPANTARGREGR